MRAEAEPEIPGSKGRIKGPGQFQQLMKSPPFPPALSCCMASNRERKEGVGGGGRAGNRKREREERERERVREREREGGGE
ncbi:hypothetical protein INR49_032278 [Caranx melampygus]|nr:hypothetical protein INR49_032278 [Caranx melampygus]